MRSGMGSGCSHCPRVVWDQSAGDPLGMGSEMGSDCSQHPRVMWDRSVGNPLGMGSKSHLSWDPCDIPKLETLWEWEEIPLFLGIPPLEDPLEWDQEWDPGIPGILEWCMISQLEILWE